MQTGETREEKIKKLRLQLDKLNRSSVRVAPPGDILARDLRRVSKHPPVPIMQPPSPEPPPADLKPILYQRDLPRTARKVPQGYSLTPPGHVPLATSVTGREVRHDVRGSAFLVETRVNAIEETPNVDTLFQTRMTDIGEPLVKRLKRQLDVPAYLPEDFIFADIETTGLNSSPLFLIGIMVWEDTGLVVRQYLARDYAEECAVIALFMEECRDRKMLVTFNGKTFDYPYIRNRAAATGIAVPAPLPHFDLLHECRRLWKGTFPNCKLQTLERYVCNRMRYGDIPGHMIPQAYHDYVRTGNAWQIVEVLRHNMIDIVTLGELMGRWPEK